MSAEGRMSAESRCVEDNVSIGLLKLSCTMEEEEEEDVVCLWEPRRKAACVADRRNSPKMTSLSGIFQPLSSQLLI